MKTTTAFAFFLLYSTLILLHHLMIISFPILGSTSWASTLGNETDQLALLSFKDQITHDPFQLLNSWNDSLHFCFWHGVTCGHRHRRVVKLHLYSSGLVGSLSPYIGNLSFLRTINLANNRFHGEIPSEVGHLFRLQEFKIHNNSFVGGIPISLSNCSNLITISIGDNKLSGMIPNELGSLPKLVNLYLYVNNLTGEFPASFGNLSFLEILTSEENNLYGALPNIFGKMKSLQLLGLGFNMFSLMLPPSIYNLSLLQVFSIEFNQFYGRLPDDVGLTLPNVQKFYAGTNQLFGDIPISLFNCSKLVELHMYKNEFTGQVPTSVGNLQNLRRLTLHTNYLGSGQPGDLEFLSSLISSSTLQVLAVESNKFGGVLHISKANFSSQLNHLYLGNNQISGNIPYGIVNLTNLIAFGIEGNRLTGNIPMKIGKLQNLQALYLQKNYLSGQIPSSLGTLSALYYLDLSSNNLEGEITSSISNCRFLQILDLSRNNLSGVIPNKILSLPLLQIYLEHNSLSGPLPLEIGDLKNLIVLNVSNNKLTGTIPSTLGYCLSLQVLILSSNFFHGSIPPSFNYFKEIQTLDLSMNNISGKIPKFLENFSTLQNLNLSFNNLTGEVPIKGVFQNASSFSIVGNNKLCGGIPQLQLPSCLNQNSNKQRKYLALKVSLSVTLFMIALVSSLFLFIFWRRSPSKKPPYKHSWEDQFKRVSYKELHKATNGFSSTNLIGIGSFGSVYKGVLHGDTKPMAIKVLNLIERGSFKSFVAECEALRRVRHRNLLKIVTICSGVDFQGKDFKALIFKFMPNGNLESWLHPSSDGRYVFGNLNLSQRISIAVDIASALDYLHNHCETAIIHCDLKPSNILLDDDMIAHISDFGLARFSHGSNSNCDTKGKSSISIKGTIGYIPPEYGVGVGASTQGDVYSFGILLLEMITGKKPTDDIFKDELNLHHFSMMALPEQVMKIVDPALLLEDASQAIINNDEIQRDTRDKIKECLSSLVKVGVACSMESLGERMGIKDALRELTLIKDISMQLES